MIAKEPRANDVSLASLPPMLLVERQYLPFSDAPDPQSQDLEDLRSNIDFLRWQIQGHRRGENPPIMNDYLALYQSVYSRTGDAMDAWNTICVGMFTHPDFWMY